MMERFFTVTPNNLWGRIGYIGFVVGIFILGTLLSPSFEARERREAQRLV